MLQANNGLLNRNKMKKIISCCSLVLASFNVMAQIQNPGFELQNTDESASYWQQEGSIAIPIDTNCAWIGMDSIRFVTNEAHSGNKAMELRVARYCDFTTGSGVKPVKYNVDSFVDQRIVFTVAPSKVSFYYKLMPEMGDYGLVTIILENQVSQTLADTSFKLKGQKLDWILVNIPFHYSNGIETPVLMTMKLKLSSDSILHYGSRFLIDDFNTESVTGISESIQNIAVRLNCFPNPAKKNLSVNLSGSSIALNGTLSVMDAMGRICQSRVVKNEKNRLIDMDIQMLQPGIYSLIYTSDDGTVNTRFVKE